MRTSAIFFHLTESTVAEYSTKMSAHSSAMIMIYSQIVESEQTLTTRLLCMVVHCTVYNVYTYNSSSTAVLLVIFTNEDKYRKCH